MNKYKRCILFVLLYSALLLFSIELYGLLDNGLTPGKNKFIQLSGAISNFLLAFGCYWELYITNKTQK